MNISNHALANTRLQLYFQKGCFEPVLLQKKNRFRIFCNNSACCNASEGATVASSSTSLQRTNALRYSEQTFLATANKRSLLQRTNAYSRYCFKKALKEKDVLQHKPFVRRKSRKRRAASDPLPVRGNVGLDFDDVVPVFGRTDYFFCSNAQGSQANQHSTRHNQTNTSEATKPVNETSSNARFTPPPWWCQTLPSNAVSGGR